MKRFIKGLFVILAIVMSFVLVQGVYARDIETFTGRVTSVDDRAIVIDEEEATEPVTIYLNAPSWYWEDVVRMENYPGKDDYLKIEAFYCNILPGWVGISVCYLEEDDNCIYLRDVDTLKPLWNPNAKTTDLSDTAAETTGDCCPDCPDGGDCEKIPNDYNYISPGPHRK